LKTDGDRGPRTKVDGFSTITNRLNGNIAPFTNEANV